MHTADKIGILLFSKQVHMSLQTTCPETAYLNGQLHEMRGLKEQFFLCHFATNTPLLHVLLTLMFAKKIVAGVCECHISGY